jgi:hypothetical protein
LNAERRKTGRQIGIDEGAGCKRELLEGIVRADSASLRFFRQIIAQPTSSRPDSASPRL